MDGGDAARLWIDGTVVVDGFERGGTDVDWGGAEKWLGGGGRGYVNLIADGLYEVKIEYRFEPTPLETCLIGREKSVQKIRRRKPHTKPLVCDLSCISLRDG